MEAEHRRAQRRRAVTETREAEAAGIGWWEVCSASNMHTVNSILEFKQHVQQAQMQKKLLVMKFFAPWCQACRSMYPKLQQLANQNPDVLFIKVNAGVPELQTLCEKLGVDRLPFFQFYRCEEGLVAQFPANLTPSKLAKLRAEIARHKQPALETVRSLGRSMSGELQGAFNALKRSASDGGLAALARQASGDLQAA